MKFKDVEIKGLDELRNTLKQMPLRIQRNVVRGALRAGVVIYRARIRLNVPVMYGDLKNSVRVESAQYNRAGTRLVAQVKAGDEKAYYAHMVEWGTAAHIIKPHDGHTAMRLSLPGGEGVWFQGVKHPGTKPSYFMTNAYDDATQSALGAFVEYCRRRIPKELAKQGAPK